MTNGMAISELSKYPIVGGISNSISSAMAMIAASKAKKIKVNDAYIREVMVEPR